MIIPKTKPDAFEKKLFLLNKCIHAYKKKHCPPGGATVGGVDSGSQGDMAVWVYCISNPPTHKVAHRSAPSTAPLYIIFGL